MKRSEILFGLLKIPFDAAAVLLGTVIAYRLRAGNVDFFLNLSSLGPPQLPAFDYYLYSFALPVTLLYLTFTALMGLYALRVTISSWREVGRVFVVSGLWIGAIVSWFFLVQRQLFFSRVLLLYALVLVTLGVSIGRGAVIALQRWCLQRGIGVRSVLSFGAQPLPDVLYRTIQGDPRYRYLGHVQSVHSLTHRQQQQAIDLVLHTDPNPGSAETVHLIDHCRSDHIGYAFLPPVFADVPHQLTISRLGLVPILAFRPTPLDGWGRVIKRLFDIIVGTLLLLIISPILLVLTLIILLFDGWPVMYVSERRGQHGTQAIRILKFRTMRRDADQLRSSLVSLSHRTDGPLFKIRNDPRITRTGRLLRRWSLDELPQLLNVLQGQLSLVGPRPHLEEEVSRYAQDQRRVLTVKPGITGLSQVSGRSELSFADEVRNDMRYIEEWSLALDLWILWRTIVVVLQGRGAD